MNIKQLEYFISVAETLNFTKAAKRSFISQTAMTQQIKALEKTVGVPLFVRDKHHVELTNAGKAYLAEARIIVERSAEALRLARLASEGVSGEITIGYIRGYGSTDLDSVLRSFHSAYPGIKIKLIRENMSVLLEHLENGKCDIAFTVAPMQKKMYHYESFSHMYIKSYPVMVVLYNGHPLANKERLHYHDLEGEEFIMMEPEDRPKDQMDESMLIYERGGFYPDVVACEGEPESLLLMVSSGMGISILPEYIIRLYQKNENIKVLPMVKEDGTAETLDFMASWISKNNNPAVERLVEFI